MIIVFLITRVEMHPHYKTMRAKVAVNRISSPDDDNPAYPSQKTRPGSSNPVAHIERQEYDNRCKERG